VEFLTNKKMGVFMSDLKPKLSPGIPVRLPEQLVVELKQCAAKQQRSISQEIRYRLVQCSSGSESHENGISQPG
jgi:hypothetical protein